MSATYVSQHVKAPRAAVYRALLDADAVAMWMVPDADGGTDIHAVHEGLPPGLSSADNALGWRMSLGRLASFVEAGQTTRSI
jgi:hypothetical protein